jgi:probable HAF family extracellular repeat protein
LALILGLLAVGMATPAMAAPSTSAKFIAVPSLRESGADYPQAINQRGSLVGATVLPPFSVYNLHATLWNARKPAVDLGSVGGGTSEATGINSAGTIVGSASTSGYNTSAVIWDASTHAASYLPPLDPNVYGSSRARGINTAGLVAGDANSHAVVWDPAVDSVADIGDLCGRGSGAADINDLGYVVGASYPCSGPSRHAFVWNPNTSAMTDITPDATYSEAQAINSAGQVVGFRYDSSYQCSTPIFWDPATGTTTDISLGVCAEDGRANDINSKGQVVGSGYNKAFMWSQASGYVDLNQLVPTGWTINYATGINDRGEITGTATDINFRQRGFILTLPKAYR